MVLKDGSTYIGTYIRTNDNMVYFRGNDKFLAYQHPLISTLKLKDGRVLIEEGLVTKQTTINSEQYEKLTYEEKAVNIEIQAAYDTKEGAAKWVYL